MKTIEEKNRMIAEFMGLEFEDGQERLYMQGLGTKLIDETFNKSWDWLMEVVEKIENFNFDFKILGGCWVIITDIDPDRGYEDVLEVSKDSKLSTCYEAVVEFIEWYAKNKELCI